MATSKTQVQDRNCAMARRMYRVRVVIILTMLSILQGSPCWAAFASFSTNSSDSSTPFRVGFYSQSCPTAESIVTTTIRTKFSTDFKTPAQIIRLFFHECFISGCDGSVLVNSTSTNQAEKAASPNLSLAGFDVVDTAKAALENACPGVVSCADIEALMTRDAVFLLGGPAFKVPTGRLDTRATTTAAQAANGLPTPSDAAQTAAGLFAAQGFSTFDFVTLMGGHTVGAAFCQSFSYRLYNYQNTSLPQSDMDPKLVTTLKTICPNPNTPIFPDPAVALDQGLNSINVVDNSYYQQLQLGHGILEVDQNIGMDNVTGPIVTAYAGNGSSPPTIPFGSNFAAAIIKLGTLNVITGSPSSQGSIRQNCAILN